MPGRVKGTKNKRTLIREYRERIAVEKPKLGGIEDRAITAIDYVGESLAVMGEAMQFFIGLARKAKEDAQKREFYLDAVSVADKLAPYRYPKYATLKIGTGGENTTLVEDGMSATELIAGVLEFMDNNGIPRKNLIDITPSGVANR